METLSRILPVLALCGWVALVPVLEFEQAVLELPVVLECTVSPAEMEGCGLGTRACAEQMPEDCPIRLTCCVCVQFGGMAMSLSPLSVLSTLMKSSRVSPFLRIEPLTRNARPPVPPPQFG